MSSLQRMGGVSALTCAATFVVGFVLFATVLLPLESGDLGPVQTVAFLADNGAILYLWNLTIYVIFGIFLVVLALALYGRLKDRSPAIVQVATAFGLIWAGLVIASGMVSNIGAAVVVDLYREAPAQAATVWLAIDTVRNGLGGGNEIVGGIWVLLVSVAALQTRGLPRALNYLGVVIGVSGLITVVPALEAVGAFFGLGLIVWFVWVGVVMLRGSRSVQSSAASVR